MTLVALPLAALLLASPAPEPGPAFERLARKFVDEWPALSPASATVLGDHRFDTRLDEVSAAARRRRVDLARRLLEDLSAVDRGRLSPDDRVDAAVLESYLSGEIWKVEELREWSWNPLLYTGLVGQALYGLLARDFAPLPQRLAAAASRLEQMPRLLEQTRAALGVARVPRIHAEVAIQQNRGLGALLDEMVVPRLPEVDEPLRRRLEKAMQAARAASARQQAWLEATLLPGAKGDFRMGPERYRRRLAIALQSSMPGAEVMRRARAEMERVRREIYQVAKGIYAAEYPLTSFPAEPDEAYRQAVIRAALERAASRTAPADGLVEMGKKLLAEAREFTVKKDLVTVPPDPVEVVVMPVFRRGVAVAYCDAPGPLDVGQKTYYAVSPVPTEWTPDQARSFLREYNLFGMREVTVHEGIPGHFLQLAHGNRCPSKLRAMLSSGTFVEGWAVYAQEVMVDAGFGDDPLQRLANLKLYLRAITNAILDQAVHVEGMTEAEAMKLMVEGAFQEEREAAGKWRRACLTAGQLSSYFVGYLEHKDLRRAVEERWGPSFALKRYHDAVLSHGAPPVRFVRALVLGEPIPR